MATENTGGRSRPAVPRLPGFAVREQTGRFVTRRPLTEKQIIEAARRLIGARFTRGAALTNPVPVREYLRLLLGDKEHEVFTVLCRRRTAVQLCGKRADLMPEAPSVACSFWVAAEWRIHGAL